MAIYVVMEPVGSAQAAEKALFVRDGVAGGAFILPVIWLLVHRLWVEALAAFALMLLAGAFGARFDHPWLGTVLSLLIGLYFALEGPALRLAALRRRGYAEWGTVEAGNHAEAELRFAAVLDEGHEVRPEMASSTTTVPTPAVSKGRRSGPPASLGLGLVGLAGER